MSPAAVRRDVASVEKVSVSGPARVSERGAAGDVEGATAAVAVCAAASDDAELADSGGACGGAAVVLTADCSSGAADIGRRGSEAGATAVVLLAAFVGWTSSDLRARA